MEALEKIAQLSKEAQRKMAEEAVVDEVVGNVAVESMNRALETGSVKHASDILSKAEEIINKNQDKK